MSRRKLVSLLSIVKYRIRGIISLQLLNRVDKTINGMKYERLKIMNFKEKEAGKRSALKCALKMKSSDEPSARKM